MGVEVASQTLLHVNRLLAYYVWLYMHDVTRITSLKDQQQQKHSLFTASPLTTKWVTAVPAARFIVCSRRESLAARGESYFT